MNPPEIDADGRPYGPFIEEAPVPVWIQSVETVRMVNREAVEFFGVDSAEDLVGESALSFVAEDERDRVRERNRHILENDRAIGRMEGELLAADGRVKHGRFVAFPVRYDGDDAILVIADDVTARREYERTLERQTEHLEEFASVLSHDLRNPLEAAYGELAMARENCDPDAAEHLDGLEDALARMGELIEETLTMARAGQHVETDAAEPVSLAGVARSSWDTVDTGAARLQVLGDPSVVADERRLRQVFENLFRNAVQHNDDSVAVRVGPLPDRDGFFVADDGRGITASRREQVFESGHSTHADGTGLGLRIVEAIVTAHGWEIDVTDGPDGGARFEVSGVEVVE